MEFISLIKKKQKKIPNECFTAVFTTGKYRIENLKMDTGYEINLCFCSIFFFSLSCLDEMQ